MGRLSGYKTYLTAVLAIVTAWITWLFGELQTKEAVQATFMALGAVTLRAAVTKHGIAPLLALCFAVLSLALTSCENLGNGVTLDPDSGICVRSPDGKYAACYNPLSKRITVKTALTGIPVTDLIYDPPTKTWRSTLRDGSTVVYKDGKLTVEPSLPAK